MALKKTTWNDNGLAIAYYRFSSHNQNELSIDQQREMAHSYADGHGWRIIAEYEDKATSGTTTEKRDGYKQMMAELSKLHPSALIIWKTDRLGRDRYELTDARRRLRDAGCRMHTIAEPVHDASAPESSLMEGIMDGLAEYYSRQLSQNVLRGMEYNAKHARFNGRGTYGYKPDPAARRFKQILIDEDAAPVVRRVFEDYAEGKPLQQIVDELNAAGLRSLLGKPFTHNSLRKMLHNEAYIGTYRFGDIVLPDAIPAIVTQELFETVQKRFELNKRNASQQKTVPEDAPRYWLTGKLYCGYCKNTMQGVSGTSRHGTKHYYYYCIEHRKRHNCKKKPVKKDYIETIILDLLKMILKEPGNRAQLAVDTADYYERYHKNTGYFESLEHDLVDTQKGLDNLVSALEQGIFGDTMRERMKELEARKRGLQEAIQAEKIAQAALSDEHSIQAYYERFADADLDDPEVRDQMMDYFIDKIFVYDDHLEITGWFDGEKIEYPLSFSEEDGSVEDVEWFDSFVLRSTKQKAAVRLLFCLVRTLRSPFSSSR